MREKPPSPIDYLDYRAFLRDWFKAKRYRPSMATVAGKVGCSKSWISMIISGKRQLDPGLIDPFCEQLRLEPEEGEHFRLMVIAADASTIAERERATERLMATQAFRAAHPIEGELYRLLGEPRLAAIRELAHCRGFQAEAEWIADRLLPRINPEEARESLETLFSLGILRRDAVGRVRVAAGLLATEHEGTAWIRHVALFKYHEAALELARKALEALPREERFFCALTVAVPSSRETELRRRIQDFQKEIIHLCTETDEPADRVHQLSIQLFPLSSAATVG